ncbi:hypothetical protein CANCADRAFT_26720 [Tortispora caseinolytica NRRL Y-17796]|uniref:Agmatinase n=1 Tax=Tortispora caseinolytica NRRL Y-17796 TaxID=767744 RepID=A0A1E4TEM1_9ASCO|nr:hypothetical protein CANCADRAFT_26720 [Tortispora caseinolytica NRRL Y-17796]
MKVSAFLVLGTYVSALLEDQAAKWDYDLTFSGISSFAHLDHVKCLTHTEEPFDIAVVGVPFDTVVSYRPGARFGPRAIRAASSRQTRFRSFNARAGLNPYANWARIIDCGDIPASPFNPKVALTHMEVGMRELLDHPTASDNTASGLSSDRKSHPQLVTLGGDHSISLAALRALKDIYGPIHMIHFDAHLDTWAGDNYPGWGYDEENSAEFTHGTMLWMAAREGLLANGSCIHAGLRTRLSGVDYSDYLSDKNQGWTYIEAHEIDFIGVAGIIDKIKSVVGDGPVYLSLDIDTIDPGMAPGTGTPEIGGWTTRELRSIFRGLEDLNFVGFDVVEVAPAYDDNSESTALAAAELAFEMISTFVKKPLNPLNTDSKAHDEL